MCEVPGFKVCVYSALLSLGASSEARLGFRSKELGGDVSDLKPGIIQGAWGGLSWR